MVAKKQLEVSKVDSIFQQAGGKRVAERISTLLIMRR
jgi:hypothetical protein